MIDVNVSLSRWPCRRLPCDETPKLVARLKQAQITQAWAGSFDALLHKDIAGVNVRLAEECRTHGDGLLVPFGAVNPMLPDWQEDLRRCHDEYAMPGIRLHPNYHGYKLDDPVFAELLRLADERRLIVQIALKMEDERTQHPLLRVPTVDPRPLVALARQYPRLQMIVLNGLRDLRADELSQLASCENVRYEISMLEGVGGLAKLIQTVPFERLLLGSHFPFFTLEAALLKLRESELGEHIRTAISETNAQQLFSRSGSRS